MKKFWKIFLNFIAFFSLIALSVSFWFWLYLFNLYSKLPEIEDIDKISLLEKSLITDRNWIVLKELFEENREKVVFSNMSNNWVNAIISTEDKNFWDNNGIDVFGIVRSAANNLFIKIKVAPYLSKIWIGTTRYMWGSTITQQVIKNYMLTNERSFKRKINEIILAIKLQEYLSKEIKKENPNLTKLETEKRVKEKILEMYSNYIFLWNNNYGIESASNFYFNKKAKDLSLLEASILAAIPRWPGKYNPITNKKETIADIDFNKEKYTAHLFEKYNNSNELNSVLENTPHQNPTLFFNKVKEIKKQNQWKFTWIKEDTFDQWLLTGIYKELENEILNMKWNKDIFDFFKDNKELEKIGFSYIPWRKDLVLESMYKNWYIQKEEMEKAVLESISFQVISNRKPIRAAHFDLYVEKFIEKYFDKDLLKKGIIVRTTLDYNLQKVAQNAISNNTGILHKYGANNSSLIHVDNKWGIQAYVGSLDFYNKEIEGENDMLQAKRQVGSIIKPLVYALLFNKKPFGAETPVLDENISSLGVTAKNSDGGYSWLIPIKRALWNSRNIPAIKAFFELGGEKELKPFLKQIGLESLIDWNDYWWSLWIGAGEVKPFEMAQAFSYLINKEGSYKLNPIISIQNNQWEIIYQNPIYLKEQIKENNWNDKPNEEKDKTKEEINKGKLEIEKNTWEEDNEEEKVTIDDFSKRNLYIPNWVQYILWDILSTKSNFPSWWVKLFDIKNLSIWVKSWTTNMKDKKWNNVPRDWWFVAYNPNGVTIIWAWNTNWNAMSKNAYWTFIHQKPLTDFYTWLLNKESKKLSIGIDQVKFKNKDFLIENIFDKDFNQKVEKIGVKTINISNKTWKLASETTPEENKVTTFIKDWLALPPADSSTTIRTNNDFNCLITDLDKPINIEYVFPQAKLKANFFFNYEYGAMDSISEYDFDRFLKNIKEQYTINTTKNETWENEEEKNGLEEEFINDKVPTHNEIQTEKVNNTQKEITVNVKIWSKFLYNYETIWSIDKKLKNTNLYLENNIFDKEIPKQSCYDYYSSKLGKISEK